MTLLRKTITRYTLITLLVASFGYIAKLHGTKDRKIPWGVSVRQGARPTMEDQHSVKNFDDLYFFGIYDGHGGANAAEFVEKHLCENFFKAEGEAIGSKLTNAFLRTDEDFLTRPEFESDCSGTTAVVAVVDAHTNKLFIANTGDSRAIVVRKGKVLLATKDHKPGEESERKRIEDAGGYVSFWNCPRVCGRLAVSRAIGDRDLKNFVIPNPDIYEESLNEGDVLVLACDGVWDVMANEETAAFVHEKLNEPDQASLKRHNLVSKYW